MGLLVKITTKMVETKTLKENNSSFNYRKLFCIKDNVVIDIQQKDEMQEKYDPLKLFNFCSFLFGLSISVRNQLIKFWLI